jgi:glyoxylase-like metal-dependent hydrolase (beta-lactamase superfamily II)
MAKTKGAKGAAGRKQDGDAKYRARVRMYRQGIGDCLLISLPRTDDAGAVHVMIDCGVLLGTPDARGWMQRIVADIAQTTGGRVDLLVVTHEHWDHVSGFLDAAEEMAALEFGEVWMSWAENPDDPQARALEAAREQAIRALRMAEAHLSLAGSPDAEPLGELMGFFGARGRTTRAALDAARAHAPEGGPRYLEPGTTLPLEGASARVHVLGPPRDEALLRRSNPRAGEGFGLAPGLSLDEMLAMLGAAPAGALAADAVVTAEPGVEGPFAARWGIPLNLARSLPFFAHAIESPGQEWRRMDLAWLDGALDLALRLDSDTNNSSLVLAIELDGGEVLLMAADAQIGNWLSWRGLDFGGVTGDDLLARTVLYKVGHHGSHNATLRAGLERMCKLKTALVPVDEAVARSRNWSRIPLPDLLSALDEATGGRVLRADAPPPERAADVDADALRFDVFI